MAGLEMTDATRLVTVWFAYQSDVIKRHSAARSPLGRASDTCHVFQYAAAKEVYKDRLLAARWKQG